MPGHVWSLASAPNAIRSQIGDLALVLPHKWVRIYLQDHVLCCIACARLYSSYTIFDIKAHQIVCDLFGQALAIATNVFIHVPVLNSHCESPHDFS